MEHGPPSRAPTVRRNHLALRSFYLCHEASRVRTLCCATYINHMTAKIHIVISSLVYPGISTYRRSILLTLSGWQAVVHLIAESPSIYNRDYCNPQSGARALSDSYAPKLCLNVFFYLLCYLQIADRKNVHVATARIRRGNTS